MTSKIYCKICKENIPARDAELHLWKHEDLIIEWGTRE